MSENTRLTVSVASARAGAIPFLPSLVLAASVAVSAVGCSGPQVIPAGAGEYAETSHALVVDIGGEQQSIGVNATPQSAAGSDGLPENAESLVAAAAAECGVGLVALPKQGGVSASARMLARGINLFPSSTTSKLAAPFFGGNEAMTCDEATERVEALVCVAGKLSELSDAVGRTEWSHVAGVSASLVVPTLSAANARRGDSWSIHPPADRDRFIARDLALHALVVAARVDATPVTLSGATSATCSQIYAALAGFNGSALPGAAGLESVAFARTGDGNEDYLPIKNKGAARAKARLAFEASTLRTASDLLRHLIDTSVQADLAGAAAKRAKNVDPTNGAASAWGAKDVYDSFAHAARVIGGRLEVGDPTAPVRWQDPACSGIGQNQLVDRAYAGGTAGRVLDPAITGDSQVRAIQVAQRAGSRGVHSARGA